MVIFWIIMGPARSVPDRVAYFGSGTAPSVGRPGYKIILFCSQLQPNSSIYIYIYIYIYARVVDLCSAFCSASCIFFQAGLLRGLPQKMEAILEAGLLRGLPPKMEVIWEAGLLGR
jgi:hypothetical protein